MSKKRKTHSPQFKAKIALAAIQNDQIASRFGVHPTMVFHTHLKTAGRSVSDLPDRLSTTIWQEAILLLTTKPRMRFTLICLVHSPRLPDAEFW